jgi:hypothetical protein
MLSRRLTPRAGLPVFYVVRAYTVPANSQVPRRKKVWNSLDEAVSTVKSGDVLLSGGTLLRFNNNPKVLNAIVRLWPLWDTRWVMRRGSRSRVQPGRTPQTP